jgi:hypothetical protein
MPGIYQTPATIDVTRGGVLGTPLREPPIGTEVDGNDPSFANPLLLAEVLRWIEPWRQDGRGQPPMAANPLPSDSSIWASRPAGDETWRQFFRAARGTPEPAGSSPSAAAERAPAAPRTADATGDWPTEGISPGQEEAGIDWPRADDGTFNPADLQLVGSAPNQRENAMVRAIQVRLGLTDDQREWVHRRISGKDYTYERILQIATDEFGEPPPGGRWDGRRGGGRRGGPGFGGGGGGGGGGPAGGGGPPYLRWPWW